jgi:Uma2 family endonuclease
VQAKKGRPAPNDRDRSEAKGWKASAPKLAERGLAPTAPVAYAGIIATPRPTVMQAHQIIPPETLPRLTPDEYLGRERDSETRHELVDGYLYAMTGASDRHDEIAGNLYAALHAHLRGGGRRVHGSNLKLRVCDDFYYPGVFVRCATERGDPYFKTDPVLIAEVLSPGTQRCDRGDKRLAYQSLPTLEEYLMISQDEPRVELLRRTEAGWEEMQIDGADAVLVLDAVGLTLPMAQLYA